MGQGCTLCYPSHSISAGREDDERLRVWATVSDEAGGLLSRKGRETEMGSTVRQVPYKYPLTTLPLALWLNSTTTVILSTGYLQEPPVAHLHCCSVSPSAAAAFHLPPTASHWEPYPLHLPSPPWLGAVVPPHHPPHLCRSSLLQPNAAFCHSSTSHPEHPPALSTYSDTLPSQS